MGFNYGRGKFYQVAFCFLTLVGCGQGHKPLLVDPVTLKGPETRVDRSIGEGSHTFQVLDANTLTERLRSGEVLSASDKTAKAMLSTMATPGTGIRPAAGLNNNAVPTLILGFPLGLLGENHVFGGVVTQVSDTESELLGRLKLSDLTPLHIQPIVAPAGGGTYAFAMVGCVSQCEEGSDVQPLAVMPVLGVDPRSNMVFLDLASLGNSLNLVQMMDPSGSYTKLKTKANETLSFDYSYSTLVFDVRTTMEPIEPPEDPAANTVQDTQFTVRWYLKLTSAFDPSFTVRSETDGVGYFTTERSARPVIQRFALPRRVAGGDGGNIHYYVKGVPQKYQKGFVAAFDEWNGYFMGLVGKRLITYEFVNQGDPRYDLVVAGDVRFNILEWDHVNSAPYGGLGPSIANQHTGEIFSANVLVQGPRILELYRKWYGVNVKAAALRAEGNPLAADALVLQSKQQMQQERAARGALGRVELSMGDLAFRIAAQQPSLEDPLFSPGDFEDLPEGIDYDTYMEGYFQELVAHELGHNLGLRHNFRGNLGASLLPAPGGVSLSIMEYLGRPFRHLNRVGYYDVMALAYGYTGRNPMRTDLFCTDEHVGGPHYPFASPECSRDDATLDPFSYFEGRLERAMALLTARSSDEAPVWTVEDMKAQLSAAIMGLGLYASGAPMTSGQWTNFHIRPRPRAVADIQAYVLKAIKSRLCGKRVEDAVTRKADTQARIKTETNLAQARALAAEMLESLVAFSPDQLACSE